MIRLHQYILLLTARRFKRIEGREKGEAAPFPARPTREKPKNRNERKAREKARESVILFPFYFALVLSFVFRRSVRVKSTRPIAPPHPSFCPSLRHEPHPRLYPSPFPVHFLILSLSFAAVFVSFYFLDRGRCTPRARSSLLMMLGLGMALPAWCNCGRGW